ncbi:MAG TPA: L-seryl-tRNA(Sec) selenium transferase [Xanthobacteraceae bacterium]|nr:L-seryl-tRNA(Sec) selenium transferase [Xanthobacteraceae bacterium]
MNYSEAFRLPSVDEVLRHPQTKASLDRFGRAATTAAVREALAGAREKRGGAVSAETIAQQAFAILAQRDQPSQRAMINLTGTVLHTNLGRALLPEAAAEPVLAAMRHPTNLEFDLDAGRRGERDDHVRSLIRELTGAEDAIVVNNNAAAVLLVLHTFANRREAIVSRGELIEIGGSFRLPDVMASAGAKLREVGTTNRTHLRDYANAITRKTGLIMKVHTSNYLVMGFTAAVPAPELAMLAREHKIPFVDDLGSGTLVDLSRWGLRKEPTVQESLAAGADLVTFSGDKLLGGPQAGIIAGRGELIARLAKNPMKRALRLDKLRLAAMEATLRLYHDPDRLAERLPTLRLLSRTVEEIRADAAALRPVLADALGPAWSVGETECASQIGSGALPLETLPSFGLAIRPATRRSGRAVEQLAASFRMLPHPVIGRIADGALVFDLRCLGSVDEFAAQLGLLKQEAQG